MDLILANSPQAKGRVERMNGVLQDRLVKELRLAGISDLERANRFLDGKYLRAFNRQFARAAASPVDVHRAVPRKLNEILSWEDERVVQGDWTVACAGQRYQLDRQHEAMSLVRRKVIVRTLRDGRVQLVYRGRALQWRRCLPGRTVAAPVKPLPPPKAKASQPPVANHPWRRLGMGVGREFWRGVQGPEARGGAAGGAGLRSAFATLRPPCVPHPQPGKPHNEQQTTKGTFSRELMMGTFLKSFDTAIQKSHEKAKKKTQRTKNEQRKTHDLRTCPA